MIYFDTDLWINSLIEQNNDKHIQSNTIIQEYHQQGYIISNLNIQEILFVLGKLKTNTPEIEKIAKKLFQLNIINYSLTEIKRATILAKTIGFIHINDCIHTAIAETYCTEIITYNKKDFGKIAEPTHIKVRIL